MQSKPQLSPLATQPPARCLLFAKKNLKWLIPYPDVLGKGHSAETQHFSGEQNTDESLKYFLGASQHPTKTYIRAQKMKYLGVRLEKNALNMEKKQQASCVIGRGSLGAVPMPVSGWPGRRCPAQGARQQMALLEFIATASCLSESSHVGDVLLYGQLTLIVIVCLKHSKTTVGKKKRRKKKNPHSTWMALFPPALLVYLYSKLKI